MHLIIIHLQLLVRCDDDEYRCADGTCIPEERLCDQLRDCSDGADEEQCEEGNTALAKALRIIPTVATLIKYLSRREWSL